MEKASDTLIILIPIFSICIMLRISPYYMIGSLLYCCCKPVRIATCLDLYFVDQPSTCCYFIAMLCRRGLGCENSWSACELFNNWCNNFIINRNHFWTGGLHPHGCAFSKDSAGVKCTQWLLWW